jgi:hypothetical protein
MDNVQNDGSYFKVHACHSVLEPYFAKLLLRPCIRNLKALSVIMPAEVTKMDVAYMYNRPLRSTMWREIILQRE